MIASYTAWLVISLVAAGWAAEPPKAASPPPAAKRAPAVATIPASEIIPRAEQVLRLLQETRFQLVSDSDPMLNSMQKEIAAFGERSNRRWENEAATITESRSLQRLNDMLREWSLEQTQLDGLDRGLARRSQILVGQENDIDEIIQTWQTTRANGREQGLPKVALEKISEVLREADAVRGTIRESMARLLALQLQVANRRDTLAKIRSDLDKAREQSGRELFVLDNLPLWQALLQPAARDLIVLQAVQSSQTFAEDLEAFLGKYRDRVIVHVMLFLVLVWLFRVLRRELTAEAIEGLGGVPAVLVLDRTFASSALLTLITVPLFYPGTAAALLRLGALATAIPVVRLLPELVPKTFRRWIYVLVVIYVLDFVRYLLPPAGLITRILLLMTALFGCIALIVLLRLRPAELSSPKTASRLTLVVLRVMVFLFGLSALSNIVGNMALAEFLVGPIIRICYAAAIIFAGAHLLMTLVVVILQSWPTRSLRGVQRHRNLIASRCRRAIRVTAVVLWFGVALNAAGLLGDVSSGGAAFLQYRWGFGAAQISIQDVTMFVVVIVSAILISRLIRFVLAEEIFSRVVLPRGVPGAVDVLSRYGILLLGFFIALAAAGVDLSKVTLIVSALGVGIGFGLQNVVNNFVSGLILVFEHPIQVGDLVEVGTTVGEVQKIGFRASVIRTPDGAEVIVPNSELIGSRVTNWCLSDRLRRISITVNTAYDTDPDRVMDTLLKVVRAHPAVLRNPEPQAIMDRFGDSALMFTVFCWCLVDTFFIARSELAVAINTAFQQAGISIPFPQQDVYVHLRNQESAGESPDASSELVEGRPLANPVLEAEKPQIPKQ